MCKAKENDMKIMEVEVSSIDRIMEEYYDPDTLPLSEEELEEIINKYSYDSDESLFDLAAVMEEYYDPSVTPLSEEEMEELLLMYGDDTTAVDNENAKEALEHDDSEVVVEDGKDGRKKSRNRTRGIRRGGRKDKKKDTEDIRVLHMNCDGYTSKKESIETSKTNLTSKIMIQGRHGKTSWGGLDGHLVVLQLNYILMVKLKHLLLECLI